jgi:hypothetical protein
MAYWHMDRATRFVGDDYGELSKQARQLLQANRCIAQAREKPHDGHRESDGPKETKETKETKDPKELRASRAPKEPRAPKAEAGTTPRASLIDEVRRLEERINELQNRETAAESRKVCRVM